MYVVCDLYVYTLYTNARFSTEADLFVRMLYATCIHIHCILMLDLVYNPKC